MTIFKSLLTLVMVAYACLASAQICTPSPNINQYGFYPANDSVPCVVRGQFYDFSLSLKAYDNVYYYGNISTTDTKVDSINNLPFGLTWQCDKTSRLYFKNQVGCIRISGTTYDSPGLYRLNFRLVLGYTTTNGQATALFSEVVEGPRYIRVIDNAATCPVLDTTQPHLLQSHSCAFFSGSVSSTQTTCAVNTGTASVIPNGGTAPFTYHWSNNSAQATATALGRGIYTVTVTDSVGCKLQLSTTVTANTGTLAATTNSSPNTCMLGNGIARAVASGGTPPYTYNWGNGWRTDTMKIGSGTFTVTVTDANTCSITASVVVLNDTNYIAAHCDSTPSLCTNANGMIVVKVTHGPPPYHYYWARYGQGNVPSFPDNDTLFGVTAGTYTVTVDDGNSCRTVINSTVYQDNGNMSLLLDATPDSCGYGTGKVQSLLTGGTPPYTFRRWDNGNYGPTQPNLNNLPSGWVDMQVTDSNGCFAYDTVFVPVNSNLNFILANTPDTCNRNTGSAFPNNLIGIAPYHYLWSNSDTTQLINNLSAGQYTLTVMDAAGCTMVNQTTITSNCDVWPGDADNDGVADANDVLQISIAYQSTGPVRSNASLAWMGQSATDWQAITYGINDKHADCDGNGVIDVNDTLAVSLNYNLTHQKTEGPTPRATDPVISFISTVDTLFTNQTAHIKVMLGTAANPVDSLSAIAFSVDIDPILFDTTNVQLNFNNSWLGTFGTNAFSFRRFLSAQNKIDMVLARKDHQNASGYGQIGEIVLKTTEHLPNGAAVSIQNLLPTVIKGCTATGSPRTYNTQTNTVAIKDTSVTGIDNIAFNQSISVYPNPSNGHFTLTIAQPSHVLNIELLNIQGQQLYVEQLKDASSLFKKEFNLSDLAKGIYLLKVSSENGIAVKRLVVQ